MKPPPGPDVPGRTTTAIRQSTAPATVAGALDDAGPRPSTLELTWPKSAQITLAVLVLAALSLLGVHALGFWRVGTDPSKVLDVGSLAYRLDLNQASTAELMQLPGVGPKTAEAIITYRRQHGPFPAVEALENVPGIGRKTLARLRPWIRVEEQMPREHRTDPPEKKMQLVQRSKQPSVRDSFYPPPEPPTPPDLPVQPSTKSGRTSDGRININTATAAELDKYLPRIGPTLAQRIIEERQKRRFISVDDLQRVHGIGAKTVERLRPHITIE